MWGFSRRFQAGGSRGLQGPPGPRTSKAPKTHMVLNEDVLATYHLKFHAGWSGWTRPPTMAEGGGRWARLSFSLYTNSRDPCGGRPRPCVDFQPNTSHMLSRLSRHQRSEGLSVCTCKSFVDPTLYTNPRDSPVEAGQGLRYPYALLKSFFFSESPKLEKALCGSVTRSEQQTWRRKRIRKPPLLGGFEG